MAREIENALTTAGLLLIARSLALSKPVVFTGAKLGTGVATDAEDLSTRTGLITYYDDADVATKRVDEATGSLVIVVQYWNTTVAASTYIDEIGIYAKVEGDASPVLFSYLTFGAHSDMILANSDASVQRTYDIPFLFGSGDSLSVTITPSGLIPADDAVETPSPGMLLRLNADGKLPTDITGDAATLGGHLPTYYAVATHRHDNATSAADGFMPAADKAAFDTMKDRVNQGVRTTDTPTFKGLVVDGYIQGARFL